eukprot:6491392-Amphidinium_carterae.2
MQEDSEEQDERHVSEEAADDRVGNDEQRKRMREHLDAGESPLGGTSGAPVVPSVLDRLMLRLAAKARLTSTFRHVQRCEGGLFHEINAWCDVRVKPTTLPQNGFSNFPTRQGATWANAVGSRSSMCPRRDRRTALFSTPLMSTPRSMDCCGTRTQADCPQDDVGGGKKWLKGTLLYQPSHRKSGTLSQMLFPLT